MFIDKSYFTGPLTIAQLGQKAVDDRLQEFIDRWEPIIVEAALGYDFYHAFLDGLNVGSDEVIEQRWLDLLNGVAFTDVAQRKRRWVGFAGGQNTQALIAAQRPDLFIYAGITPGFPVGGYQYTNASLNIWNFTVELFGAGTLEPIVEWNYKAGGGVTLTNTAYTTTPGERWVIHFTGKKVISVQSGGQNTLSPLAGFIYYEYMADLASQNTGIGVVKSEGENSVASGPARKIVDAYNDACSQISILHELLYADIYVTVRVYPEFDYKQIYNYFGHAWNWPRVANPLYTFQKINEFGI